MDSTIDQLSLKIDIDVPQGIDKTISSLARAINKLNQAVSDSSGLEKYVKTLRKITSGTINVKTDTAVGRTIAGNVSRETTESSASVNSGDFKNIETSINQTTLASENLVKVITEDEFAVERLQIAIGKLDGTYNLANKDAKEAAKAFGYTSEELDKMSKNANKTTTTWYKFIKSLGRIALYRTIRRALQIIADTMKEGVQNYAQYSETANQALSNIKSSFAQLKNTFGVTLGYILEILSPAIKTLADSLISVVNSLNMALSAQKDMNKTYSKAKNIYEDYADSLKKTNSQLLDFDKFSSLSKSEGQTNPSEMFEEADISDDWDAMASIFTTLLDVVKVLVPLLKSVWDIVEKILPTILNLIKPIIDVVNTILELVMPGIDFLVDIVDALVESIVSIIKYVNALFKFLKGDFSGAWKEIANGFAKGINAIVNIFVAFYNLIIDSLNVLFALINPIIQLFGGNGIHLNRTNWKMNWQPYADGGTFTKGTHFIAGEAGAEAVYNTSGGNGGVVNIKQFRQAMVEALAEYGVARNGNGGDMVLNVDGRELARTMASANADALSKKYRVEFRPR